MEEATTKKPRLSIKSVITLSNFFNENKDQLHEMTIAEVIGFITTKTNITLTKAQLKNVLKNLDIEINFKRINGLSGGYKLKVKQLEEKVEYLELLIKEIDTNVEKKLGALRGLIRSEVNGR